MQIQILNFQVIYVNATLEQIRSYQDISDALVVMWSYVHSLLILWAL